MKKFAILTALSVISMSSFAMAESPAKELNAAKSAMEKDAGKMQKDAGKMQKDAGKMQKDAGKMQKDAGKMQKDAAHAGQKIGNYKGMGGRAMAQFKKMDTNSDGTVSQAEFTAFNTTKFNQKDKNKDGNLTPTELSPTLAKKIAQQKS